MVLVIQTDALKRGLMRQQVKPFPYLVKSIDLLNTLIEVVMKLVPRITLLTCAVNRLQMNIVLV